MSKGQLVNWRLATGQKKSETRTATRSPAFPFPADRQQPVAA